MAGHHPQETAEVSVESVANIGHFLVCTRVFRFVVSHDVERCDTHHLDR